MTSKQVPFRSVVFNDGEKPAPVRTGVLAIMGWAVDTFRRLNAASPADHRLDIEDAVEALATVEALIEASSAVCDFTPEAQREKWPCHYRITTAAKCGRCSRDSALAAAIDRAKGETP